MAIYTSKNRAFGRNLKKQMRELEDKNKALRSMLNVRNMSYTQLSDRLNSLENRIKRIDNQYIVSQYEANELSIMGNIIEDVVRENLVRDIIQSDCLHKLIKVDVDPTFCGVGTRYNVSLQVLSPTNR